MKAFYLILMSILLATAIWIGQPQVAKAQTVFLSDLKAALHENIPTVEGNE